MPFFSSLYLISDVAEILNNRLFSFIRKTSDIIDFFTHYEKKHTMNDSNVSNLDNLVHIRPLCQCFQHSLLS